MGCCGRIQDKNAGSGNLFQQWDVGVEYPRCVELDVLLGENSAWSRVRRDGFRPLCPAIIEIF